MALCDRHGGLSIVLNILQTLTAIAAKKAQVTATAVNNTPYGIAKLFAVRHLVRRKQVGNPPAITTIWRS